VESRNERQSWSSVAGLDLADIPDRIQAEVQRAISAASRASNTFPRRDRRWDRPRRTSWRSAAP
jgi:hypothetical protein